MNELPSRGDDRRRAVTWLLFGTRELKGHVEGRRCGLKERRGGAVVFINNKKFMK